jgi:glyoxylase-like metal-dependent hydrolase (beta-lactamase superfamily II)
VGDTLFMPEFGTARCDFPGGDAATLYKSIREVLALPPETILYVGHEYPAANNEPRLCASVAEQRARNIHINDSVSEAEFVELRTKRDRTLDMPALMLPAIQVNIRAGHFPPEEGNGVRYLKIPLDLL